MRSDDQHVILSEELLQQTHFTTFDKQDSVPPIFTQLHSDPIGAKDAVNSKPAV